jgi:hypothetical protein
MKNSLILLFLAVSAALSAQVETPKWEFGGGVRFNYMRLNGKMSGSRNADGYNFDISYKDFSFDLGYRFLYMNLRMDNDGGWYNEKGFYQGPYATIRMKFFSKEMLQPHKSKDKKK